jgi:hypothetical protein
VRKIAFFSPKPFFPPTLFVQNKFLQTRFLGENCLFYSYFLFIGSFLVIFARPTLIKTAFEKIYA